VLHYVDSNRINEYFKELGPLSAKQRQWADLKLDWKLTPTGGGMWGHRHLQMLRSERGFIQFEKRWIAWWENTGSKKYAKEVRKASETFHKIYVFHDGAYRQRSQLETTLTDDEIRWIKAQYRSAKEAAEHRIGMTDKEIYESYMKGKKGGPRSWCHGYLRAAARNYAKEHGLPFNPTL